MQARPGGIPRKWRPTLALVLGATLAAVLCLPLAGIVAVRYLFPVTGYQEAVILTGLGVLACAGVTGFVLWRILLRPITAMAERAGAIRDGAIRDGAIRDGAADALVPLPHYGTVEMMRLYAAMLSMGRVLQGREAVLRSYADHATHEMRAPLTVLKGAAELLALPDLPGDDRARLLDQIAGATARIEALLDAQRRLARAQEPLGEGTVRLSDLSPGLATEAGIAVEIAADATLPLPAETARIVLGHLAANAAAQGAGRLYLAMEGQALVVSDDGPGIAADVAPQVFDPFFTTRRDAGGTGMGLPIVQRMLAAHGAGIALDEAGPLPGATFRIRF